MSTTASIPATGQTVKMSVQRDKLLAGFQIVAGVVPARSPKPILQNVKLEATEGEATVIATDLEIGIRRHISDVDVQVAGSVLLPSTRFLAILRESGDERLELEADPQGTLIKGERSEYRLPAGNPDEFPSVAEFSESDFHELPSRLLRELFRRTVFATDTESSRYALGGVLMELESEKVTCVGTDGRRLARMEGKAKNSKEGGAETNSLIIPTRAVQQMERALSDTEDTAKIATQSTELLLSCGETTVFARLLEGRFPRWRDVFPKRDHAERIELTVGPLLTTVRQAAIVTSDESRGVDFTFENGRLVLSGNAAETGQSRIEMPISYEGSEITVTLDPRYVADFLKVLETDKQICVEVKDGESAAVLSTDDGYGYVVMPLARDR